MTMVFISRKMNRIQKVHIIRKLVADTDQQVRCGLLDKGLC